MSEKSPRMKFDFDADFTDSASIVVVGVGGAGGNAVARMIEAGLSGVDFININTDAQVLAESKAIRKVQIGRKLTKGLGSGGDPEIGRAAIEEDEEAISELVAGADMVFVTAGMGGGTGTGASPTVARAARAAGALTVGVVTKPFAFEGWQRMRVAEQGLAELRRDVDTLITIPNQRLFEVVDPDTPFTEAFDIADDVLLQATRGISDLITVTGLINLDFADVKSVMAGMGAALMGVGSASGEGRAETAAKMAISCPLLQEQEISGAQGVLINLTGSRNMTLREVTTATDIITEAVGQEANIIFGTVLDEANPDDLKVTVIATGFGLGADHTGGYARESATMAAAASASSGAATSRGDERTTSAESQPEARVIEIVQEPDEHGEPVEARPVLAQEAEAMRAEVLPKNDRSQGIEDLDIPTFLRKQSD